MPRFGRWTTTEPQAARQSGHRAHLPGRFVLAALAAAAPAAVLAQSNEPGIVFFTGMNWRIEADRPGKTLKLVGETTDGPFAYFAVQCVSDSGALNVAVPMTDPGEKAALASAADGGVKVRVWSDHSRPQDLTMKNAANAANAAYATSDPNKRDEPAGRDGARFLAVLDGATTHFEYQAGGRIRTYDASLLQAALKRFRESCAAIRKDFDGFMKGRIS